MHKQNWLIGKRTISLFLFLVLGFSAAFAHDSSRHKKAVAPVPSTLQDSLPAVHWDSTVVHMENSAPLTEFPTLHPLIVHVPIVFLVMAAVLQLLSLFLFKRELSWTTWGILLIGFIGAYASSNWFHVHTTGLSPEAEHILQEHESYAVYTQWLSGIAVLIQSVNLFFLKRKMWLNTLVAVVVIAAAFFVALAGHHGAELVHKHGIGARGYKLEQHHH